MGAWAEAAVLTGVAGGLAVFGRWGRAYASVLVPRHFADADRARRIASIRRGSLACFAAAGALALVAVLTVL